MEDIRLATPSLSSLGQADDNGLTGFLTCLPGPLYSAEKISCEIVRNRPVLFPDRAATQSTSRLSRVTTTNNLHTLFQPNTDRSIRPQC